MRLVFCSLLNKKTCEKKNHLNWKRWNYQFLLSNLSSNIVTKPEFLTWIINTYWALALCKAECIKKNNINETDLDCRQKHVEHEWLTRDSQCDFLRGPRGRRGGPSSLCQDLAETGVVDGQGDLVGAAGGGHQAWRWYHLCEVLSP